jgi:hypothetical protein
MPKNRRACGLEGTDTNSYPGDSYGDKPGKYLVDAR